MKDLLTAALLLTGSAFMLLAAVGVARFPDVLMRLQATAKAGTLGIGLILSGVAVHFAEAPVALWALLILAFLFVTAPVAAHMIGRAAYVRGERLWEGTTVDEWRAVRRGAGEGSGAQADATASESPGPPRAPDGGASGSRPSRPTP